MRNFEDVLSQTGWGLYNKYVVFFTLLCSFCASAALTVHSFALPVAVCEIKLTQSEIIWINAILALGEAVGFLWFGFLSDLLSRKVVLTSNLVLIFLSCFACGFCYEFIMFFTFSFVMGASASATYASTKVQLSEILPMKHRGYYIILVDVFWIFGCIFSSCTYWIMRCRALREHTNYHYISWRLLYGFSCMMSIVCLCLHGLVQTSPRKILASKRKGEAFILLRYIFSLNNSDHVDNFRLPLTSLDNLIQDIELDREYLNNCKDYLLLVRYKLSKMMIRMCKLKTLLVVILISILKSGFYNGFLETNILLVKSLNLDFHVHNCNITSLDILFLNSDFIFTSCIYVINASTFRDFVFIGLSGFMGLILFSYLVDKIGRHVICVPIIICGVTITNFIYQKKIIIRYILATIYMLSFSIANSAADLIIIENLPTIISDWSIELFPAQSQKETHGGMMYMVAMATAPNINKHNERKDYIVEKK